LVNILENNSILSIQKVDHCYDKQDTNKLSVSNLNLVINSGEFVSIIGPSGCGKTTILNLIAGLLSPISGEISIFGFTPKDFRTKKSIGMVFQSPAILPWLTVFQNLLLPLQINPVPSKNSQQQGIVENILSRIQMEPYSDFYPHQLSGGMKQRVGIGMALVFDPKILLLDEPLGSLDEITRGHMRYDLIENLRSKNKTIIMVTHSIEDAVVMSDQIIVLSKNPATVLTQIPVKFSVNRTKDLEYRTEFISLVNQVKKYLSVSTNDF